MVCIPARYSEGGRMTSHRVPAHTVSLGHALLLVTQQGDRVTQWDEVDGWNMLTSVDAMEHEHARIFLVPGKLRKQNDIRKGAAGSATYGRWHERDAALLGELKNVPDELGHKVGRALRIDYSSDKWNPRGERIEYTHDFLEDGGKPPLVYTDNPKRPRGFVLSGGSMAVTEGGIA